LVKKYPQMRHRRPTGIEFNLDSGQAVNLSDTAALLRPDTGLEDDPLDPVRLDGSADVAGGLGVRVQRVGIGRGRTDPADRIEVASRLDHRPGIPDVQGGRIDMLGDLRVQGGGVAQQRTRACFAPDFVSHIGVLISQHPTASLTCLGGSEDDPTRPWQRSCRQALETSPTGCLGSGADRIEFAVGQPQRLGLGQFRARSVAGGQQWPRESCCQIATHRILDDQVRGAAKTLQNRIVSTLAPSLRSTRLLVD
jgi:hypothetical protein